ncbi:MAG: DUF4398 domain-containing protein [Proteobacteria bacterium]|nr:DUF4398 domain-containing protein [Pseudomonadota bacterium]
MSAGDRLAGRFARTRAALGFVSLFFVSLAGCGPIGYLQTVTVDARDLVQDAEDAGARELAPYEYHAAWEYLRMAREFGARADFELAIDYGKRSARLAREGRRRAAQVARDRREVAARRQGERERKAAPASDTSPAR